MATRLAGIINKRVSTVHLNCNSNVTPPQSSIEIYINICMYVYLPIVRVQFLLNDDYTCIQQENSHNDKCDVIPATINHDQLYF